MPQSAIDQNNNNQLEPPRIQPADIVQMFQDLFTAMLGLPLETTAAATPETWTDPVSASIEINGDWNAEFRVNAPMALASHLGCAMFGIEDEDISHAEIFDAMGEIVNVIGGNAKGIIDGDCQLSLPEVGIVEVADKPKTLSLGFQCSGLPFNLHLHDRDFNSTSSN